MTVLFLNQPQHKRVTFCHRFSFLDKLFSASVWSLSVRHWVDVFPRHPQLPRPDAGRAGHPVGANVCHRHVVSEEVPAQSLQEGQVPKADLKLQYNISYLVCVFSICWSYPEQRCKSQVPVFIFFIKNMQCC